jgi:hypothetical protein
MAKRARERIEYKMDGWLGEEFRGKGYAKRTASPTGDRSAD